MAPKKTATAAAPLPTAASTRKTRKTSPAPLASDVAPPAAAPSPPKPKGKKPKAKNPELRVVTGAKARPLFSNPALEDYIRTRILDGIENFRAQKDLKRQLEESIKSLKTCITSFKKLTPEVGPGFGSPDGDPNSAGTPPKSRIGRDGGSPVGTKGVVKKKASTRKGKK